MLTIPVGDRYTNYTPLKIEGKIINSSTRARHLKIRAESCGIASSKNMKSLKRV